MYKFYNIGHRTQCYKTFYVRNFRIFVIGYNVLGRPFQPSLMFMGKAKAEAYPGMENLKGFFVCVPALLTNIRPGWKGLPWTNTLAY
jgi:hypothetical protein